LKKQYEELQKKLKNTFVKQKGHYEINGSVGFWLKQCDIQPTPEHLKIIYFIFGAIPYPYQESDRLEVLDYLNTYSFSNTLSNT